MMSISALAAFRMVDNTDWVPFAIVLILVIAILSWIIWECIQSLTSKRLKKKMKRNQNAPNSVAQTGNKPTEHGGGSRSRQPAPAASPAGAVASKSPVFPVSTNAGGGAIQPSFLPDTSKLDLKVGEIQSCLNDVAGKLDGLVQWKNDFGKNWGQRLADGIQKLQHSEDSRREAETATAKATLNAVNDELKKEREKSGDLETKVKELQTQLDNVNKSNSELTTKLEHFKWQETAMETWAPVINQVQSLLSGQSWYDEKLHYAILQTMMSLSFPVDDTGQTLSGSPADMVSNIDEAFYGNLHGTDGEIQLLESVRKELFGKFNEKFVGRYEIRWPTPGSDYDSAAESYCRLAEDNGYTRIRVAMTCAIFGSAGKLLRRAKVETVPKG